MEDKENSIDSIYWILGLGTSGMLLLAAVVIIIMLMYSKRALLQKKEIDLLQSQHQKEILSKTLEVQESERESIAKDLHDDIGALVSLLKINNMRIGNNLADKEKLSQILSENLKVVEMAMGSIRSLSKKLSSSTIETKGYIACLKELVNLLSATDEIKSSLQSNVDYLDFDIPAQVQLFRLTQELITNIVKHSKPSILSIAVEYKHPNFSLLMQHNGSSFEQEEAEKLKDTGKGLGLKSLFSRASLLNGRLSYSTENTFSSIHFFCRKEA